jgi:lipopolysaccharide export system protein LptA
VWTPKRILLLVAGFAVFFSAYASYSHFLGGIDGLAPLPEGYGPVSGDPGDLPPPPPRENSAESKLRVAFGEDCPEAKDWKIKLELQSRRIVLASQDMVIMPDGRLQLTPFSLAIFGKERGAGQFPEINTVRSQEAYLTLDKPVNNITEIGGRKIIGGELRGDIYVMNNRGTPARDDDICLFTQGPLYYQESLRLIWTKQTVRLTDPQSKPKPMTINGTGMHLYLSSEPQTDASPKPGAHKPSSPAVSGLERVVLQSDVDMNLWVDSRSGILGSTRNNSQPATATAARRDEKDNRASAPPPAGSAPGPQAAPVDKSKVVILTQGPFSYDVRTDKATFDISQHAGPRPNVVTVDRLNESEGKLDHLQCDHLEMQFHRKNGGDSLAVRGDPAEGLDLESVHATGKEVVLTSDAEILEAHGTDFSHDRRNSLSILKGSPRMWALKEGNEIEAPELQLRSEKGNEEATAVGAGHIRMLDKTTGKRPLEATWQKKLIYAKEGPRDVLTLMGNASFVDHEHSQQLQAERLKVWLEPSEQAASPSVGDQQRRKPQQVEALEHVVAIAPEMHVHDTERLSITFRDVPPAGDQLPPVLPPLTAPANDTGPTAPAAEARPAAPGKKGTLVSLPGGGSKPAPGEAPKAKKPLDLSARSINAHILRSDNKNDLDKLWCEGVVRVHQDPATPEDRGVDIRGETLELTHHIDGNVLWVTGNHAQLQLNKLFILGPDINIDQTTNEAEVRGLGAMRLPSRANLDGSPLDKETELTISWENRMLFRGQDARFWGKIHAEQGSGHLACSFMQVFLDRKISLREGEKTDQPAKVQKLVCDKDVWIEDFTRQGRRLVASKRIDCISLSVDNDTQTDDSQLDASGPGRVRLFQVGTSQELLPGLTTARPSSRPSPARPGQKPVQTPSKGEEERKLTQVIYQGKMSANNKRGIATFYDKVELYNVPATDPDMKIDDKRLPPDGVFLTCEKLEVLSHKLPNGTTTKEMRAYRKVFIESQDFSGLADVVKYDESKEQIILEGTEGKPAILYREKVRGRERETIKGKKITYMRLTGDFHVEGGTAISGSN